MKKLLALCIALYTLMGLSLFAGGVTENTTYVKTILSSIWTSLTGASDSDIGPAGGYIFYDKGSYSDGWRYLEAAPESTEWRHLSWGDFAVKVETGTAIGTGKSNTQRIVSKFRDAEPYAAKLCTDLIISKDGVAYDDWFLPSKDELELMYKELKENDIGGFSDGCYWSSSEVSEYSVWYQYFANGDQYILQGYKGYRVRAVRAF